MPEPLPVDDILPRLIRELHDSSSVVLRAPPGAGKTTRVPPAILASDLASRGKIVVLEPRRIAARTAARRMAHDRCERVGDTVGYRVRFEEATSRNTRILVVTEGILLRWLQENPFLEDVSVVIFDEFHERRAESDLALAMVRRVQQTVRPDLRIVVMSATLDSKPIAAYLGDCPVVESEGRLHPVRIEYLPRVERQHMTELATQGIERVLQQTEGDVLVFLPGTGEIMRTRRELEPLADRHRLAVFTLFGDMTAEDQDRVLAPCPQRKVVLSTNVAETSVTIEGVTAVVDTGFARQMHFDADVGLDRLELARISKASTDQRAGRAGRTQPGVCLRLWEESAQRSRPDFETPELSRVDLSSAVLRLYAWGETDVAAFPWFEAPPEDSIRHAEKLLRLLGAIDDRGVTRQGEAMLRFPLPPRIARLLLESQRLRCAERAVLMAAMLSERDAFLRVPRSPAPRGASIRTVTTRRSRSDVLDRLHELETFVRTGALHSAFGEVNPHAVRTILQSAKQLSSVLESVIRAQAASQTFEGSAEDSTSTSERTREAESSEFAISQVRDPDEPLLRSLVAGFPDRVARRRDATGERGLMVGGRGVRPGPGSAAGKSALYLCIDIDGAGVDAVVRQASEVQREWLPSELLRTSDELFFHPSQKQVVARRRLTFDDLVLEETPTSIEDTEAAAEILFQAARAQLSSVMPASDDRFSTFVARARCLKTWMPELPLEPVDESMVLDILKRLCQGRRSFAELRSAPWLETLQSELGFALVHAIDREAPERITLPGGVRITLIYEENRPPVLPVLIQDIFGMQQTPRVAGGRVPVLLHLLAPSRRPQQVTDDLASFWANTYPNVRKELKRRYPKHHWPDDPLTAAPGKKRT